MDDIMDLIRNYGDWLNKNINLEKVNGWISISTPFLDHHNDHLEIFVKPLDNNEFLLTDDGYIISDLLMSGCDINTPKRKETLEIIVNRYGVNLKEDSLLVKANNKNFHQKKHMLLQTMMTVNDMFMLSQSKIIDIFLEEVEKYFETNDISFISTVKFSGASGFTHAFDFVIPKSKDKPERLLNAVNKPTRSKAESILFAWDDVRKIRNENSKLIVLFNDREKKITSEIINAFNSYGADIIPWTERNNYVDKLTA